MNTSLLKSLVAALLIPVGIQSAFIASGQTSDQHALTLVEVVQRLENDGYGPFTELSMDDGNWEVEARKNRESVELTADPDSGKVLAEHRDDPEAAPPADAMTLSDVLRIVLDSGSYKTFDNVSFERRYWEIEVHKDGQKHELHVDPITGTIIAERVDD